MRRLHWEISGREENKLPRLKDTYKEEIIPAMMQKFSYKNVMQVPRLEKVVINMGMGDIKENPKGLDSALNELALISGQKPVVTIAKRSVANFKLREGMRVGAKVTIRGTRMYEFVDKLISIAIPRVRDFRGLSANSFDGRGNFSMGFREQLVFPEIDFDKVEQIRGMDIAIVTTAKTDEEARELLSFMGMPFDR
jgi:large subunit ribosomal protein L5